MPTDSVKDAAIEDFDVCPYCGAANPAGAKKCSNCGEEIEEGDQDLY